MEAPRHTLILMRHGKSAYPAGVPDHDRPLADRGRREAGLAGIWIATHLPAVDEVRCSTAQRTRQTLAATKVHASASYEGALYDASPHEVTRVIQAVEESVDTLLVVGHAPGIPWTAWTLAANRSDLKVAEMSEKFPTSAIAAMTYEGTWAQIGPGSCELTAFIVPR